MKHTKEEIINALMVIKDECNDATNCDRCPFGDNDGRCKHAYVNPSEWEIVEPEIEVWRALK